MYLIKCKCGCSFTVKEDALSENRNLICQNCKAQIPLLSISELMDKKEIEKAALSVSYIPDNAKITVTFDA